MSNPEIFPENGKNSPWGMSNPEIFPENGKNSLWV